jgi:Ice-binding-like
MKRTFFNFLGAFAGFAALLCGPFPALAQVAPPLGVLKQFSVLGNSGVTGSTGVGVAIDGDVGSSPTASITNFPPSSVTPPFTLHLTNDLTVQQAHSDAIAAYNFLVAQGPGTVLSAQLDGAVLTSGIYSFAGGAADLPASGTLTLDGPGIFIFQVNSALTANVNSNVIGTANPCNVFWRVGTSATLNGISFRGDVIADASITVGSGANVTGRVIAGIGTTGAVTMAGAGGNMLGGCVTSLVGVEPPQETLALTLGLIWPNPSRDQIRIDFVLGRNAPAILQLVDASGRQIAAEQVGSLGTGRHTVLLAPTEKPRPGIYFVRLSQNGRNVTQKVAWLR